MRETEIDAVSVQDTAENFIKFHNTARLAVASLLTHGVHPHVFGQINFPHPHRNDVNEVDPSRQRADPPGGKTKDGIVLVGCEIKE